MNTQKLLNDAKNFGVPGLIFGGIVLGGVGMYKLYTSIFNQNNQLCNKKKQAKEKQSPEQFRNQLKKITEKFLKQLQEKNFHANIQRIDKKKHVMFIGPTSAGKSSLINQIFHTKLKTGVDVTTSKVDIVFQDQKIRVFDSAGQNSDFEFFDIKNFLSFIPRTIENLVRVICGYQKAKYRVIFIRTCCDQFTKLDNRSIDQQIQQDYQIIKSLGVEKPIILKTSTKQKQFDNDQIKKLL